MWSTIHKLMAFTLVVIILSGCKKDLNYRYAFDVNGALCQGNNYTAFYQYDTAAGLHEFVADFYIGSVSDTNYVQLSFSGNNYITVGTYYSGITNPGNTVCSFGYYKNHIYYNNIIGIVQVTQSDTVAHSLKGSFQFSALSNVNPSDSVQVTNGAFAGINYVIE